MTEERSKIMDNLIAQDADLIDDPLQAAVRELLTDDSMEHLGTFTHNLVQAFDRHGLKAVSTDYLDNLHDTVRGLRQDIKAEQKHTDTSRSGDLVERLRKQAYFADRSAEDAFNEAADHIEALEAALREVFEEWAGSEGFIPETAPEGYLLQLTKRMADIARAALGETK